MIRRRINDEFWLVTQHDHAILAGEMARHIGNRLFEKPVPFDSFVAGVANHDGGWPLHDDEPTLTRDGFPRDVFESTLDLGLPVWQEATRRAIAGNLDPYSTLLVSIHVLSLSLGHSSSAAEKSDPRTRFDLNRFQHEQIEIQEKLRPRLGLRNDIPLHHGLAEDSTDTAEQTLIYHFRLLQAMDRLSLNLLCQTLPFEMVNPVPSRPGGKALTLKCRREGEWSLRVSPWPFKPDALSLQTSVRKLPAGRISDLVEFRRQYAAAAKAELSVQLLPG